MSALRIHVIGAHGRSGYALSEALVARGHIVIPIVRREGKLPEGVQPARIADLNGDPAALKAALRDADIIVNTTNASYTSVVLAAMPDESRLVAMGSTRLFTRFPDKFALDIRKALRLLSESRVPNIMLLPSMIYGARADVTTRRLVGILQRLPVIPLPKFGRMRIQPVFQGDVTLALMATIELMADSKHDDLPPFIVIAGPRDVAYRDYLRMVVKAAGLRRRPIISVPVFLLKALIPILGLIPGVPHVTKAEIDRLTENRCFSIADMSKILRVTPIELEEGLSFLFSGKNRRR